VRTKPDLSAPIRFSTHNPENIIVIENYRNRVIFRAGLDNFSARRKAFLIRQLAAEGYIPDCYEQFSELAWPRSLIWLIDRSLMLMGPQASGRANRAMKRLILAGCALWLVEISFLLLRTR
jgi:hypothetical protein